MLNRDKIIGIVAKEHNILISKDDPILALLSVHQVLLSEYAQKIGAEFESLNQQYAQLLEEAQNHYVEQSKNLANQVVGESIKEISNAEKKIVSNLDGYYFEQSITKERISRIELILLIILIVNLGSILIGLIL